ncbi:tripartite tricarboxylate transporter substrate binding protein [Pseudorhodoferax sp. LjRoot39]|uniref:tripartite tricarboxylate transporter substrate binding protein n=1 Tax=Pseudorhodoferax sp. LjRoot39 TaxID=3342328 RepID=UPI003ECDFB34
MLIVIPFPAGGLADSVARALLPLLEAELGVPAVPINRPGASGAIGAAHVASAKPDGYTLLLTLSSITTLPEQARVNGYKPAFELQQLAPIARFSSEALVLVVPGASHLQRASQLIEQARRQPRRVSYASSGNYGAVHLPVEGLAAAAAIQFNHVPYAGGAPALQALLGQQVDFSLLPRSAVSAHMRSGRLRALATLSAGHWSAWPDVPTFQEAGINIDHGPPWTGMFVPAATSKCTTRRLRAACANLVASSEFFNAIDRAQGQLAYLDAPDFERLLAVETVKLGALVRRIGKLD